MLKAASRWATVLSVTRVVLVSVLCLLAAVAMAAVFVVSPWWLFAAVPLLAAGVPGAST